MIAWMIWATLVTTLLALAAAALESGLQAVRRPGRAAWIGACAGSIALMAWSAVRPESAVPGATTPAGLELLPADIARLLASGPAESVVPPWSDAAIIVVWAIASGTIVLAVLGGTWRLMRRARRWPAAVVGGGAVLVSDRFGPALVGLWSPRIVVPRWALRLGAERLRIACLHEEEHRRAGDSVVLLTSALATAAAPWNPALWWIHRRLRTAVEIDCDQRVLAAGTSPLAYGALLLELGTRGTAVPRMVAAFARPKATLERRMTMIVSDNERTGWSGFGRAALGIAAAAALTTVACEAPAPTDHEASEPVETVVEQSAPESAVVPEVRLGSSPDGPSPMVFVDGERMSGDFAGLDDLDPNGIERIEIIKGAAAAALYGDEAAGGVVQIFLKDEAARD